MEDVRKNIRFINSDYKTLFTIKDGDSIKITSGYNGEEMVRKCRFLDEAHIEVGTNTFHCCEFAERMEAAGNKYEPAPNQKPNLDILAAKYGEQLQGAVIPMTEAAVKQLVGGKYEVLHLNGENCESRCAILRGKSGVAVCGIVGDTLTSLHPYWAQKYKRELSPVELPKQPSLQDKLERAKTKAAEQNTINSHSRQKKRDSSAELE